jgi:hypothetical protein
MNTRKRRCHALICLVVSLGLGLPLARAQRDTGTIRGTVLDATGAVVPHAQVTVTDERTEVLAFATRTDELGRYAAPALKPSTYRVTAEIPGFKKAIHRGVVLEVNQVVIVNITLEVGQVTELIEVTAEVPMIRADSAELGDVVEYRRIVELPLNGRFFVNLVPLTTGVTPPAPVQNPNNNVFLGARAGQPGMQVHGQRPGSNNYTVDGIDNAESTVGNIVLYPPVDAIQEFKVQTTNQDAEFGKNPGATVNVVIRSGTNELRGNVYHFVRNDRFDARNFFDRADQPKPPFRLNQYGATLGGPIIRNKTFAFGFYEGYKIRQAQTFVRTVPTARMRTGDLSELGRPIYDPLTLDPSTNQRQRFPGDRIPLSRLNPVSLKLIEMQYPLPNRPGIGGNFVWNPKRLSDSNQFGIRLDHQFREKDSLFGRFMMQNFTLADPSVMPLPILPNPYSGNTRVIESAEEVLNVRGLALGWTRILSPGLVNEFRAGFTRERVFFPNPLRGTKAAEALGIRNVNNPAIPYSGGLPVIGIGGFTGLGESGIQPFIVVDNNFEYADHVTWLRGGHAIKFGGNVIRRQFNFYQVLNQRGNFSFDGSFTSQLGVGGTGSGFGDFLLGFPLSSTLAVIENPVGQRQIQMGAYFSDTWRASSKLTLIFGLRYELFTPRVEIHNRQANFDPRFPGGAVVVASPQAPCGRALRCLDTKNFAPRFGFAYQASKNTVVRGGYGIFYDDYAVHAFGGITTGLMINPPFWRGQAIINPITAPTNRLQDGVPPVVSVPVNNGRVVPVPGLLYLTKYQDPYGKNSYVQQWNFTVEREVVPNLLAAVSYVGNKGTRNMYSSNINQAEPGPGPIAPRRPFPAWPDITSMYMDGLSNYNSLQAKLHRRFSGGISFLAGYTWAKSIDNAKGEFGAPMIVRNLKADRGRSDWDIAHRFVISGNFELPFGPGKVLGRDARGLAQKLIEGWTVSPIVTLQTGLPFTPTLVTPVANTGTFSRPDRIGSGKLARRTPDRWFDETAFTTPALYTFGNSGRNILTGPGTYQVDVNFAKNTALGADRSRVLQFRAEFFNLFNTPQFNNPVAAIGSPAVGRILSAGDPANFTRTSRQIQFGLKFYF